MDNSVYISIILGNIIVVLANVHVVFAHESYQCGLHGRLVVYLLGWWGLVYVRISRRVPLRRRQRVISRIGRSVSIIRIKYLID
jgi:hypothetical protein